MKETDMIRLESLMGNASCSEVLKYIKEHNVKLKQEMLSYLQLNSFRYISTRLSLHFAKKYKISADKLNRDIADWE